MKLKLIYDPHPLLRQRAQPVDLPLSKHDTQLLQALLHYVIRSQDKVYAEKHHLREGVGLAAPQVGISKRLLAISFPMDDKRIEYALANPIIISSSVKKVALHSGEGCLSVNEAYPGYVYRSHKITVKAFDLLQNKDITILAYGFEAIVLQHEIDHLNGVLFYDYIAKDDPFKELPNADIL
jgi:peptide deformylase